MVAADADDRKIRLVAVVSPDAAPCFPCGACRQVLHEFGCEEVVVLGARASTSAIRSPRYSRTPSARRSVNEGPITASRVASSRSWGARTSASLPWSTGSWGRRSRSPRLGLRRRAAPSWGARRPYYQAVFVGHPGSKSLAILCAAECSSRSRQPLRVRCVLVLFDAQEARSVLGTGDRYVARLVADARHRPSR
jgi:hypothetical protein